MPTGDSQIEDLLLRRYYFPVTDTPKVGKKISPEIPEEQLGKFVLRFQKMIPDTFSMEIDGENFDAQRLKGVVETLIHVANDYGDALLLHFVARSCIVASAEFGASKEEEIAKMLFEDLAVSGAVRKRHAGDKIIVSGVTALGAASILILEENPKYPEVLRQLAIMTKGRVDNSDTQSEI